MFNTTEELIEDIRNGKMVILVDDEDRENEGDIVLAADHVTPQAINFMAMEARGLICLSLSPAQIENLSLPQMVRDDLNFSPNKTAFTVSIEASFGVTTGISAHDRAHTIRVASNPLAKPQDVHTPGHIFPIRAQAGGVLKRAGHTEGSVDLARLAGLNSAAVICEVMNANGTMARVPDLKEFAQKHNLKIGTIVDLIEYRLKNESLIEKISTHEMLSARGSMLKVMVFKSLVDHNEHIVIQKGEIKVNEPTLVRVHLDNFTRDLLTGLQSGGSSLHSALNRIEESEQGLLLLLRGNNRQVGLGKEIEMLLNVKEKPSASIIEQRDYGTGAQILRALGVSKIRLLTNHPEKQVGLKAYQLEIIETLSL